ncbi:unnamed protein product [Didymodactylos carnosus]|uniref:JmjC domain-containing protein n=1 Tax=Didymodactylos carnosus TaxID=1234261 RepID=A0A813PR14_9BILA|nr:unnamed protein product [Didymodactylos carnosus]CAF3539844.1 unnamed protein product [Didymodactylos carnosus]
MCIIMTSINDLNKPYIFNSTSIIRDNLPWTPEHIAVLLKKKKLPFRLGKRIIDSGIQFEKDCHHIQATVEDFIQWNNNNDQILVDNNEFSNYSNKDYFAYADYMHFRELFADDDSFLKLIDWSQIGLRRNSIDSTLWIGSQGAYTPCHFDTYGINFVLQVFGRKRWLLFSPKTAISKMQTRIPYEESSVYANINFVSTNRQIFESIKDVDTIEIILKPGDVLFIPKHWWHFVYSLDKTTISLNTWLEQPDDSVERTKEMISRYLISSIMTAHMYEPTQWLNHNEILTDNFTNLTILSNLLQQQQQQERDENDIHDPVEPPIKRCCVENVQIMPAHHIGQISLEEKPFCQTMHYQQCKNDESSKEEKQLLQEPDEFDFLKNIVRAVTSPDTIDFIYKKLIEQSSMHAKP